jgi:2-hydroxychromene-2-carboxylate isomerase
MAKQVEFLFDYGSPFSYLASTQMPALAERTGAAVVYRPIALGAVHKATGNSSPMTVPAKGKYMGIELSRWAARYRVPFQLNRHRFMSNTMFLVRGAVAAQRRGVFAAWHEAINRAVWAEALDLGDSMVLGRALEAVGFPASEFAAAIAQADIKDELRRSTDEAVSRGVFGAPTFFVGDEMFWGNDRLEWVEAALKREE